MRTSLSLLGRAWCCSSTVQPAVSLLGTMLDRVIGQGSWRRLEEGCLFKLTLHLGGSMRLSAAGWHARQRT